MDGHRLLADYFRFSRKERMGVITLALLILVVAFLPQLLPSFQSPPLAAVDSEWIAAMNRLDRLQQEDSIEESLDRPRYSDLQFDRREGHPRPNQNIQLFPFDPNTVNDDGWKRLGISERTIRTIRNFQARGGRFRRPEDLGRIYGLPPSTFSRLRPFIRIPEIEREERGDPQQARTAHERRPRIFDPVDVNLADTTAFIALPGIGSRLAARIVSFREKLGGFHSVEQLREVYGIADSVFEKLRPLLQLGNAVTRKININTADIDELKSHPYIRFPLARAIIQYREQHGPFGKVDDLLRVMAISPDVYRKIIPYVNTGE